MEAVGKSAILSCVSVAPAFLPIENSQKCDGVLNTPGLACTITWPLGKRAAVASAQSY